MADILPFVPKKSGRLDRAARTVPSSIVPDGTEVLVCGACGDCDFIIEAATGDLVCAECFTRSANYTVVKLLT